MVYEADSNVSLLEALAEAGGITNDAGDTIIVTRARPSSFALVPNPEPISPSAPGAADSIEVPGQSDSTSSGKAETPPTNPPSFPAASELAQNPPPKTATGNLTETSTSAGNIITINLNDLLETGDTRNNIPLQAGDVVTVPHAGIIYVLGAVNHPGGFVLSSDRTQLTSMKVLALAGGLTRIAKLDHAVIIRKDDQGKQTETEVDLKEILNQKSEDIQLRASDVLYIPDNHVKEALLQALQIAVAVTTAVAIYRIAYQ